MQTDKNILTRKIVCCLFGYMMLIKYKKQYSQPHNNIA